MDPRRLNVLLDLDNTIINSLEPDEIKIVNPSFRGFQWSQEPSSFETHFHYEDMDPFFRVYGRPHLETFLDFLFEHFNVGVFTAAESEYALFIVKHFIETKPGRKVNVIFYRYHVDAGEKRYGDGKIKDLRLLWEHYKIPYLHPYNTILIDDLIDVKETNPFNVFRIKSFDVIKGTKPNEDAIYDRELFHVIDTLRKLYQQHFQRSMTTRDKYIPILYSYNNT
jgi:TFIIF-interacting CTD phosphatase-like protein